MDRFVDVEALKWCKFGHQCGFGILSVFSDGGLGAHLCHDVFECKPENVPLSANLVKLGLWGEYDFSLYG